MYKLKILAVDCWRSLAVFGLWIAFASNSHAVSAEGQVTLPMLKPVMQCSEVARLSLGEAVGADTRLLSAVERTESGHVVCEVKGEISPHVTFLARMPVNGWSQRYLQTGCGGLCGMLDIHVDHAENCPQMTDGSMVLASTDMGHAGKFMGDGDFGRDPQARIDFAYRGVHLTAVAVKALIKNFYGYPARYRYFSGCSDGGREALMEAQRYPDDFDGIAAGAPAMNFQVQNSFYHAWQARSNTGPNGKTILTSDKLSLLHAAVLKICDGIDGVRDGVIEDPRACKFDPEVLRCTQGQDLKHCLTNAQVEVVRRLYAGPTDAEGHRFTAGGPQFGSELSWRGVFVTDSSDQTVPSTFMALGSLKNLIFEERPADTYGILDFKFDVATFDRLKPLHALNDATNPDLTEFFNRGGRLILWHGWSDPHISPLNTIAYYSAIRRVAGGERADAGARLFMIPGLYHCGGGEGPVDFDLLTPLMQWVEAKQAPQYLAMSHSTTMAGMPRAGDARDSSPKDLPLGPPSAMRHSSGLSHNFVFAYPALSHYKGEGDRASLTNYEQRPPLIVGQDDVKWLGDSFIAPGFQLDCHVVTGNLVCSR